MHAQQHARTHNITAGAAWRPHVPARCGCSEKPLDNACMRCDTSCSSSACMPWVCVRILHRLLLAHFCVTVASDLTGPAGIRVFTVSVDLQAGAGFFRIRGDERVRVWRAFALACGLYVY
eukprot:COSAG01_NODE_7500_length_3182_cov_6.344145_4_plen_120_part_00